MHAFTPLALMDVAERKDARTFGRSMLLTGSPVSPEALSLTGVVTDKVAAFRKGAPGQLRPSSVQKYGIAVGAFLTDLFDAARGDRWSKLETNTNALPSYPGGSTAFRAMRSAMGAAGLLEELPGYIRHYTAFGHVQTRSHRTSFRPSAKLLHLAGEHGFRLDAFPQHFRASRASVPTSSAVLEARAQKKGRQDRPERLPVNCDDPKASCIAASVGRLNAYLMEPGRIEGIAFAGLRRVFSNADRPDFDWQWHGRYYSIPGSDAYEGLEGGSAARAKVIRIDGQEVSEVDVSACHLTILHGLLGVPFYPSEDPYALPGVSREAVKEWLTMAMGASSPDIGGPKLKRAREAAIARYPFLRDLATLGVSTLALQYHESEIMRLAMDELMGRQGIGFLPVHDALMVAKGNEGRAAQALRNGFARYFMLKDPAAIVPRVR